MKRVSPAFLLAALVLLTSPVGAQVKKYDVKSGIVTFEQTISMGNMKIKSKVVLLFDDFGMKECKDTYRGDALEESFFSDGTHLFAVKHKQKAAYQRGKASRGTEMRFDWSEVSEKDKKEGKATQLPPVMIAGRTCASFQVVSGSTTSVFAGWKNITLLMDVASKSSRTIVKAVKVEENAAIPPGKFSVPSGYKTEISPY